MLCAMDLHRATDAEIDKRGAQGGRARWTCGWAERRGRSESEARRGATKEEEEGGCEGDPTGSDLCSPLSVRSAERVPPHLRPGAQLPLVLARRCGCLGAGHPCRPGAYHWLASSCPVARACRTDGTISFFIPCPSFPCHYCAAYAPRGHGGGECERREPAGLGRERVGFSREAGERRERRVPWDREGQWRGLGLSVHDYVRGRGAGWACLSMEGRWRIDGVRERGRAGERESRGESVGGERSMRHWRRGTGLETGGRSERCGTRRSWSVDKCFRTQGPRYGGGSGSLGMGTGECVGREWACARARVHGKDETNSKEKRPSTTTRDAGGMNEDGTRKRPGSRATRSAPSTRGCPSDTTRLDHFASFLHPGSDYHPPTSPFSSTSSSCST